MPIYHLSDKLIFPSPKLAMREGLLAIGGDLSPERLLLAYQNGIFPWYSDGDPIMWWSPDPRLVLYLNDLRISRSLARTIRRRKFSVTMDTHFEHVVTFCAGIKDRGRDGTWITSEMADAYISLHRRGFAHSVETWFEGKIVGGLYGVSLGKCFFGESMFSNMSDASKVALVCLRDFLQDHNFNFIDCQLPTDHLKSLGACEVSREDFLTQLDRSVKRKTLIGPWYHPHEAHM